MKKYLIPTAIILVIIEAVIVWAFLNYAFCLWSCSTSQSQIGQFLVFSFFAVPIVGSIASYQLYKRSLPASTKQKYIKSDLNRYKYVLLVIVLILVTLPWTARTIDNAYYAYKQRQYHQDAQASKERSERHEKAVGESRQKRFASTCVTVETLSSDLQTYDVYADFQEKKSSLRYDGSQDRLDKFNVIQKQMQEVIKQCTSEQITPTEERSNLLSLMNQGLTI